MAAGRSLGTWYGVPVWGAVERVRMGETHREALVFAFGERTDGHAGMRDLLGGKGANLAEMARIGLPVPPGFTISTAVCAHYYDNQKTYPEGLREAVGRHLEGLEAQQGKRFGAASNPLLVSVRSGSRESMPGMMDTILNLGLNDDAVAGLAAQSNDERFAYDCYRRFIAMYGDVVLGIADDSAEGGDPFETLLEALKAEVGAERDADLDAPHLMLLIERYKALVQVRTGKPFPRTPSSSFGAPSARCSAPGRTNAPCSTASATASRAPGEPP